MGAAQDAAAGAALHCRRRCKCSIPAALRAHPEARQPARQPASQQFLHGCSYQRPGGSWRRGSARCPAPGPQRGASPPRPASRSAQTSSRPCPSPPACSAAENLEEGLSGGAGQVQGRTGWVPPAAPRAAAARQGSATLRSVDALLRGKSTHRDWPGSALAGTPDGACPWLGEAGSMAQPPLTGWPSPRGGSHKF